VTINFSRKIVPHKDTRLVANNKCQKLNCGHITKYVICISLSSSGYSIQVRIH